MADEVGSQLPDGAAEILMTLLSALRSYPQLSFLQSRVSELEDSLAVSMKACDNAIDIEAETQLSMEAVRAELNKNHEELSTASPTIARMGQEHSNFQEDLTVVTVRHAEESRVSHDRIVELTASLMRAKSNVDGASLSQAATSARTTFTELRDILLTLGPFPDNAAKGIRHYWIGRTSWMNAFKIWSPPTTTKLAVYLSIYVIKLILLPPGACVILKL